jgi:hypothetical protein
MIYLYLAGVFLSAALYWRLWVRYVPVRTYNPALALAAVLIMASVFPIVWIASLVLKPEIFNGK